MGCRWEVGVGGEKALRHPGVGPRCLVCVTCLSCPTLWGQLLADTVSVTVSFMAVKVTVMESCPSTVSFICSFTCR